jgi:4-alpha-glucanotransferase
MERNRSSGVLAHITSLPSSFGIGDIGPSSYRFIDFLVACNQSVWQILPLGPTNSFFDDSPYMSISAFAGSPLLISPELLEQSGLITKTERDDHPEFSPYLANYMEVSRYKKKLLQNAFKKFSRDSGKEYQDFLDDHGYWLDDYALFMACKKKYGKQSWSQWPDPVRDRKDNVLADLYKSESDIMDYFRFEQFIFYSQWEQLREYSRKNNIRIFGDLPIYVGYDSVDVWAHRELFSLDDKTLQPDPVAGVTQDYFSPTGQRWGNPLYCWNHENREIEKKLFQWWKKRIKALFSLVDMARIDHFRGFSSYWAIPRQEPTAEKGEWKKGPGKSFFTRISREIGHLDIAAEDLGIITPEVRKLRDDLQFPGMKVLQFAFDDDPANSHLPHNYTTTNCIVYTGTHDNDTTVGWFLSHQLNARQRETIKKMVNRELHDNSPIHRDLIHLAQSSIAMLTIFPLQDVLGFGNDCRMNSPGVAHGNWKWRCSNEFLTEKVAEDLSFTTHLFGRGRKEKE